MQSPEEEVKKSASIEAEKATGDAQYWQGEPALSETWRKLLGMPEPEVLSSPMVPALPAPPPLASDPWSDLLHKQGMEQIDLQQIRSHCSETLSGDQDVEQALQKMQEETRKKAVVDERKENTNK